MYAMISILTHPRYTDRLPGICYTLNWLEITRACTDFKALFTVHFSGTQKKSIVYISQTMIVVFLKVIQMAKKETFLDLQ